MSATTFEACQYLTCTCSWSSPDTQGERGNVTEVRKDNVHICAEGPSADGAREALARTVAGINGRAKEFSCTPRFEPSVRERKGFAQRLEEYYRSRQSYEACQDVKVTTSVVVPHAGAHEVEADFRPVEVAKIRTICGEGRTEAGAAEDLRRKVQGRCSEEDVVRCEEQGEAKVALVRGWIEAVAVTIRKIGFFFGSGREPRHVF